MLFWGMTFVWTKIVFRYLDPFTVVFLRMTTSSILLFSVLGARTWHRHRSENPGDSFSDFLRSLPGRFPRQDAWLFLLLAFFEPFLYFVGESFGLKLVDATVASAIIASIPVFMPVFTYLFLREKLSPAGGFGLVLSFLGVCLAVMRPDFKLAYSALGIASLFLAVFAAIGYGIVAKKLTHRHGALSIIAGQNSLGALFFFPLALGFELPRTLAVQPTWELAWNLAALTLFGSTLAFLLYTIVVRELGVNRSNVFINLIPIFTAIFSFLLLGENLSLRKSAGIGLVVGGVLLAQLAGRLRPAKPSEEEEVPLASAP